MIICDFCGVKMDGFLLLNKQHACSKCFNEGGKSEDKWRMFHHLEIAVINRVRLAESRVENGHPDMLVMSELELKQLRKIRDLFDFNFTMKGDIK